MNPLMVFLLYLCFVFFHVEAQSPIPQGDAASEDAVMSFQPSLAVVIGVLCILFVLTFLLLLYAKFCHSAVFDRSDPHNQPGLNRSISRFSGIDKTVIESLPFFRFSSLKGSKEGLECSVCLSKFEDIEILRFLPKCKHAFHIDCVDQWLERHSSCPLCRRKVSADDLTHFTYSNSMRFLRDNSELQDDSNIELFVQREEEHHGSSRFSIGSSFRKTEKRNEEEQVLIQEAAADSDEDQKVLHKFNHKIIASDVVFKNRWSSVTSSDLMFLNSEMLSAMSSNRFSASYPNSGQSTAIGTIENEQILKIKEEMEMKRLFESKVNTSPLSGLPSTSDSKANSIQTSSFMNRAERRSMSEITAFSRFRDSSTKNRLREPSLVGNSIKEERTRRLWLPIARRTVQWFANRERSQQPQNARETILDV